MKTWKAFGWIAGLALLIAGFAYVGTAPNLDADTPPGFSQADEHKRVVIRNESNAPGQAGQLQDFMYSFPGETEEYCSGACDCEVCVCEGTLGCCLAGCDGCFDLACRLAAN